MQQNGSVALAFNNLPQYPSRYAGVATVLTLAVAVWRPYVFPILHLSSKLSSWKKRDSFTIAWGQTNLSIRAQEDKAIPQDELDDKTSGEAGVHVYVVSTLAIR